MVTSFMA